MKVVIHQGRQGWKTRALRRARFRCERCGHYLDGRVKGEYLREQGLVVHHKDGVTLYSGRADNRLSNLKVLCKVCHQIEHGFSRPRFCSWHTFQEQTWGRDGYFYWNSADMRWQPCRQTGEGNRGERWG